ncbi:protein ALP1-like, partial [Aphis craccivora]
MVRNKKKRLDCGDKEINPVGYCIKNLEDRHKVIEHRAWQKLKAKDTFRENKIVAFTVINAIKAKRKIGIDCKRKRKRTKKIKINGILLAKKKNNDKRPLTSRDVIKYVVKFNSSHFRGVFLRDNLLKKPHSIGCGILNLDVSSGNGSHWVAFYKIKDKQESVTLSLTGNTTTLSVHYFPSIDVYDDSEIALLNLQTYNTYPNINETNNNFEIHLENPD